MYHTVKNYSRLIARIRLGECLTRDGGLSGSGSELAEEVTNAIYVVVMILYAKNQTNYINNCGFTV